MPKAFPKAGLAGLIGGVFLPRTWLVEAYPIWLDIFPIVVLAATGIMSVTFIGAKAKGPTLAFGYGAFGGLVAVTVVPIGWALAVYFSQLSPDRRQEIDILRWIIQATLIPRSLIISPLIAGLSGVLWKLSSDYRKRLQRQLFAIVPSRTFWVGLIGGLSILPFLSSGLITGGWIEGGFADTLFIFFAYSLFTGFSLGILLWPFGLPLVIMAVTGGVAASIATTEVKSWTNAFWRGSQSGLAAVIPLWIGYFLLMTQLSERAGPAPSLAGESVAILAMIGSSFLIAMTIISPILAGIGGVVWKLTLGRGKVIAGFRR
ncbi:MAG: hypothetical protein HYZ68_02665 [Chloroflexi bacterium]|nr:hypothetical protein [Chloroflexota bacterium]